MAVSALALGLVVVAGPSAKAAPSNCATYKTVAGEKYAVSYSYSNGDGPMVILNVCVYETKKGVGFGQEADAEYFQSYYLPGGSMAAVGVQENPCYGSLGGCKTGPPVQVAVLPGGCGTGKPQLFVRDGTFTASQCL